MQHSTDKRYLLNEQYSDSSRLEARIALHRKYGVDQRDLYRWIFDLMQLPANARVLEVGCGPGFLWLKNSDRLPTCWSITVSDFSPGMLNKARETLAEVDHYFEFEQIDAQQIPAPSNTFDAVIANHTLYHVPNRDKAFAEIRRVMRPRGRLYASTNGVAHMRELQELYQELDPTYQGFSVPFNLENAAGQLEPFFNGVVVHRFDDELVVDEVEPLVQYILSSLSFEPVKARVPLLRRSVQERISRQGAFRISRSTGLIEARRG
jgi:SAM-dependent methyltransferase